MSKKPEVEMRLTGGSSKYEVLNKKIDQKQYMTYKAIAWNNMLNERMKPVKWHTPSAKGTKVDWEIITTQEEYDAAIAQLKGYMTEINTLYPELGIHLTDELEG